MLAFLSITGIFLSIIFVFFNYRKNHSSIFLSLFFFSLSAYSLVYCILFLSNSVKLIALLLNYNIGFLMLLTGPSLYFYIRSVLTDQTKFKWVDGWHLLPILIFFVIGLKGVFIPWEQKLQFASEYLQNNKMIVSYFNNAANNAIFFYFGFFFRPAYVFAYLASSVILFVKHISSKVQKHVFENQKFMYVWLTILFVLLFVLILSHTAVLYVNYFGDKLLLNRFFNIVQIVSLTGLTGLFLSPFLFPGVLYGLPQYKTTNSLLVEDSQFLSDINSERENSIENEKEEKSYTFENDYLLLIESMVNDIMYEQKPYLNPNFNMAMLSVLINIPVHHLAYYFKEYKNQSLTDFRNELRIEYAKKLMQEGKSKSLTLEAISGLSGFSSRNTFLVSFKKYEHITPKEFLDRIKIE